MTVKRGKFLVDVPTEKCQLCGTQFPTYWVHNNLWWKYARNIKEMCLKCLGIRMGRKVRLDDLKPGLPCNTLLILYWAQNEPNYLNELYGIDEKKKGA